ncbi:MAG: exonuclease domain-containing protein [Lachnospiraceae bacterium]|jgi:inhibitor of KinA sporulation pathway (predicted exonuclease)
MFYLVIDLEMCRVPRDYRNKAYHYAYETIQIGAVLLNEEFKQVGTIREYVHPEHGVIDPFIEKLTGIKNSQVKKAPCIGEALVHMIDWIGDREYKVYAWSESDRNQLLHEITAKQITDESVDAFMMEDRWVDYQMVFSQRFQLTRRISLEEALGRADIDPKGKFHDGMDDAVNTGLLVEKLEMNPDYQLISYEMPEKPSEHLGSTLGELFAGLNLTKVSKNSPSSTGGR